jgi:hypothetical protein
MAMTNACMTGCAHGGMYTWNPGLMHPGVMHPGFGMYGPPVPHPVLLEKQEKSEQSEQSEQRRQLNTRAAQHGRSPPTTLQHASFVGATGIYASTAPITACVMQCMGMGLAAMKEADGGDSKTGSSVKKKRLRRLLMKSMSSSKKTTFSDRLQMTYSCMAGCNHGTPFMFNWTNPLYVGNLHAWALTHQGSVALLPTQVSTTPLDGTSCVMQCLAMGGESMVAWNKGIDDGSIECCDFSKTTEQDKAKMSFSCQHGCTSGTPFMFNWTHPAMPGDVSAYVDNPYLSNHPFVHPYWLAHKPKSHAACVMQCLSMGNAALKADCLVGQNADNRPECNTAEMKKLRSANALKGVPFPDQVYEAKQALSASCMQGCSAGIPFMFNWTDSMMPGIPVASPHTWMQGLTSHLGTDDGGSLGAGDFGANLPGGAPMSPFNPPSDIARGPTDRGSCIAQCLGMGHDSVSRHDQWVAENNDKAKKGGIQKVSEMQKTQMFYTCAKGCDAGTPFMFNFTNPSMPGLPILPEGNTPFGSNWTAPLLPGLPPKPLYGNSFNDQHGHPFYGSIYNFSHPFYPFFGHPNGVGGTFQSVGKGHVICIIKQVKAFKLDPTYKAMTQMDPKRNKGLADFLRACAPYAWVEFGPKGVGNDHMTHVHVPEHGVTGFGNLRGQANAPRFSRPSGGDNQNMNDDMAAMAAVQKRRRRRRRRLLLIQETEIASSKNQQHRQGKNKGFSVSTLSSGGNTVIMGMANAGSDAIGQTLYAPASSTSNVKLPPPLSNKSPLDAVKVVSDPIPLDETSKTIGAGSAPMVGLGPHGGASSSGMSGFSLLEIRQGKDKKDGPPFTPNEGGGFITSPQPGGVPPQPSPIDMPKNKLKQSTTQSTTGTEFIQTASHKGFTTTMFATQTPTNTAMAPSVPFDTLNQIARAYGIQGSMSTTQLPLSNSIYAGKGFVDGAPIVPRGPAQVANGKSEMINHALCIQKCKEMNDDVAVDKTEKLEKCLESCYVTYAPHLYTTLPQTK